ncbi:hypothetical protein M413DRAFT_75082 [Hebeloma cylindrosporum]|uniref:Uncharacterized protein n=1 Tax=Hebeloma cylindrosporum TaxID=76867 RepID=A0A0C3C548_HEBCY|nr:hypothetical protein M413DRAFT_75082 [Hebeloma cylindrosporum h7]
MVHCNIATCSYCFFGSISRGKPFLSATGYVRRYYREPEAPPGGQLDEDSKALEEDVLSAIHPFQSVPLITMEVLSEAWPYEYTASGAAEEMNRNDEQPQGLPSLTDLALGPALEQVLLSGDIDSFELIMAIPDKAAKIQNILCSRQKPIPDSGIPLLKKLFNSEIYVRDEKSLDLSHLALLDQQIFEIATQLEHLDVLNLSHNDQASIYGVEKILVALPRLRRLVVLNTDISEEDVIALLERRPEIFHNLEAFIHPAFLKNPSQVRFKGAFMHLSEPKSYQGADVVSLPFFTTGQIIQGLMDYFKSMVLSEGKSKYGYSTDTRLRIPIMAAYASQVRRPGHSWGERIVPVVPACCPAVNALTRQGQQWLFVFLPSNWWGQNTHSQYAFARVSGEAWDEFLKMKKQINEEAKDSTPPMSNKEKTERLSEISKALGPRIFHIFDIQQFFKELELEGREAPSPKTLEQLFNIFSQLDTSGNPRLMDAEALVPFFT